MTLDPEIAQCLRREMQRTGRSVKATLNEALREGLARRREAYAAPPFTVEARLLGVTPELDCSNVGELLEVAEGPGHR